MTWTARDRATALDLYRIGFSLQEVKDETGVPVATLQRWTTRAGIARSRQEGTARAHRPTPIRYEILRLRAEGLSHKAIALRLGRAESTVREHLKRTRYALEGRKQNGERILTSEREMA